MDARAQQELYNIKSELQSIINEMRSIATGVRRDFSGIGSEKCANTILNVVDQYEYVKRKLNNIDTSAVTDEFAAAHSGGGGTSRGGGASRKF